MAQASAKEAENEAITRLNFESRTSVKRRKPLDHWQDLQRKVSILGTGARPTKIVMKFAPSDSRVNQVSGLVQKMKKFCTEDVLSEEKRGSKANEIETLDELRRRIISSVESLAKKGSVAQKKRALATLLHTLKQHGCTTFDNQESNEVLFQKVLPAERPRFHACIDLIQKLRVSKAVLHEDFSPR